MLFGFELFMRLILKYRLDPLLRLARVNKVTFINCLCYKFTNIDYDIKDERAMLKIKKKFLLVVTFVIPNPFFQLDFLLLTTNI